MPSSRCLCGALLIVASDYEAQCMDCGQQYASVSPIFKVAQPATKMCSRCDSPMLGWLDGGGCSEPLCSNSTDNWEVQ